MTNFLFILTLSCLFGQAKGGQLFAVASMDITTYNTTQETQSLECEDGSTNAGGRNELTCPNNIVGSGNLNEATFDTVRCPGNVAFAETRTLNIGPDFTVNVQKIMNVQNAENSDSIEIDIASSSVNVFEEFSASATKGRVDFAMQEASFELAGKTLFKARSGDLSFKLEKNSYFNSSGSVSFDSKGLLVLQVNSGSEFVSNSDMSLVTRGFDDFAVLEVESDAKLFASSLTAQTDKGSLNFLIEGTVCIEGEFRIGNPRMSMMSYGEITIAKGARLYTRKLDISSSVHKKFDEEPVVDPNLDCQKM